MDFPFTFKKNQSSELMVLQVVQMCEGLSGSVRFEIKGSLVRYSQEVLCCVLEQDTLSSV